MDHGFFALTPEQGADCLIYLASSTNVEGTSGRYFAEREPVNTSPESCDAEIAHQLWQMSADLVGL